MKNTGYILTGGYYMPVINTKGQRVNEDGESISVNEYKKRGLYFDELPDEQHTESN